MEAALQDAWVRERRNWTQYHKGFSTDDTLNPRWRSCWPKAARFILENGCDPDMFIHAQFQGIRLPMPNQLYSQRALEKYQQLVELSDEALQVQLESESRNLRIHLREIQVAVPTYTTAEQVLQHALLDRTGDMSLIFRYCMAAKYGLTAVTTPLWERALYQYLANRAGYDRYWGDVIPDDLRQAAAARLRERSSR